MAKVRYDIPGQRKRSGTIIYVYFGILVFILLFFPFYGMNLRYQLGTVFSELIDKFGTVCLILGGIMVAFSVVSIFTSRFVNTKYLIIGIVLLWAGCWCTGAVLNLFGTIIGEGTSSGGSGWH